MKRLLCAGLMLGLAACAPNWRATGDLGLVVERADGRLQMVETTHSTRLAQISGLGDLSHASLVFSRDERFAFVFGRDGGLTKVDMLQARIVKRVLQAGNSIGGAISQDGSLVAVANYTPGGVKVFDTDTLDLVADIPAMGADGTASKVVGLEDAPGNVFAFSLYEAGEIWLLDIKDRTRPSVRKFADIGKQPYDALITEDGRYYLAGLFGEDGIAMLDLWNPDKGVRRILDHYGRGQEALPVYKMPHLEGWAASGNLAFLPAIGRHEVLVVDMTNWREVGRIQVAGQPVFAMLQPGGRRLWVNFALPDNGKVQVIDVPSLNVLKTIEPGQGILHMEFTPRGERVWLSARDSDQVSVWDTASITKVAELPAMKPSGIFFTARAHRMGL
ncbi:MAG: NirF [Rhodospirillaceae bacterium]|nr:MAG: NirF [Rhodospirillaceae bacterium]TNC98200.1 MAG: NirF protein [Stygiobacter sp.]